MISFFRKMKKQKEKSTMELIKILLDENKITPLYSIKGISSVHFFEYANQIAFNVEGNNVNINAVRERTKLKSAMIESVGYYTTECVADYKEYKSIYLSVFRVFLKNLEDKVKIIETEGEKKYENLLIKYHDTFLTLINILKELDDFKIKDVSYRTEVEEKVMRIINRFIKDIDMHLELERERLLEEEETVKHSLLELLDIEIEYLDGDKKAKIALEGL